MNRPSLHRTHAPRALSRRTGLGALAGVVVSGVLLAGPAIASPGDWAQHVITLRTDRPGLLHPAPMTSDRVAAEASPTPGPTPTGSPTPTPGPTPSATPTPTGTRTASPTPTATPSPTGTPAPPVTPPPTTGFVQRTGTALTLDGAPYRFHGLNIYNLNSRNNCGQSFTDAADIGASLDAAGSAATVIRTWFFQNEALTNGTRDWAAFDRAVSVAAAHHVKIVATLVNEWGQCENWPSYASGYKTEDWYANGYRTSPVSPGASVTYRQWAAEVVGRYANDPTILSWQLVNEAEDRTAYANGTCSATAPATLRAFATDMAGLVKSIDPHHLVSLGTVGSGQCGSGGTAYAALAAVPGIDLCEVHDYTLAAMPGDQWNGLATRIRQCAAAGKPLFVGESGVLGSDVGGSLTQRAALFSQKVSAQFGAGVAGLLIWDWRDARHGGSSLTSYEVGPADPALAVLAGAPVA